jgi:hypothetical protein
LPCALARLCDIEEITHFQRHSLGGELAQLGVGDTFQWLAGVDLTA